MTDRNKFTRDGDPLVDRGTLDSDEDQNPPIDESDNGPRPVIIRNDAEPRNTNDETHPTIAAEDAKNARSD